MLRERFIKGIADELAMKEDFEKCSEFQRLDSAGLRKPQIWTTKKSGTILMTKSPDLVRTPTVKSTRRAVVAAALTEDMDAASP